MQNILVQQVAGKTIYGKALETKLRAEGFTVPTLPELPELPPQPEREPGEYNISLQARYDAWFNAYRKEWKRVFTERDALCNTYAVTLSGLFKLAYFAPRKEVPEIRPYTLGKYKMFARVLMGLNDPPVADPIHFICYDHIDS